MGRGERGRNFVIANSRRRIALPLRSTWCQCARKWSVETTSLLNQNSKIQNSISRRIKVYSKHTSILRLRYRLRNFTYVSRRNFNYVVVVVSIITQSYTYTLRPCYLNTPLFGWDSLSVLAFVYTGIRTQPPSDANYKFDSNLRHRARCRLLICLPAAPLAIPLITHFFPILLFSTFN